MCYFCFVKKFVSNALQRSDCLKYSKYLSKRLEGATSWWPVSRLLYPPPIAPFARRPKVTVGYMLQATSTRE